MFGGKSFKESLDGLMGVGLYYAQNLLCIAMVILGPMDNAIGQSALMFGVGVVLLGHGSFQSMRAVRDLGESRTGYPEPRSDGSLVRSGIYSEIRHPMYGGLLSVGMGWCVIWESYRAFAGFLGLLVVILLKSFKEEALMSIKFAEYSEYRMRTNRFWSWFGPTNRS